MAPSLSACRVANALHSFLGWFKIGFGWLVNACPSHSMHHCAGGWGGGRDGSSHFIHKAKEAIPQSIKRVSSKYQGGWFWSVPGMQGDGFASKPGGITKVEMWLCTPLLVGF